MVGYAGNSNSLFSIKSLYLETANAYFLLRVFAWKQQMFISIKSVYKNCEYYCTTSTPWSMNRLFIDYKSATGTLPVGSIKGKLKEAVTKGKLKTAEGNLKEGKRITRIGITAT